MLYCTKVASTIKYEPNAISGQNSIEICILKDLVWSLSRNFLTLSVVLLSWRALQLNQLEDARSFNLMDWKTSFDAFFMKICNLSISSSHIIIFYENINILHMYVMHMHLLWINTAYADFDGNPKHLLKLYDIMHVLETLCIYVHLHLIFQLWKRFSLE